MDRQEILDATELTFFAQQALQRGDLEKALIMVKSALAQEAAPMVSHAIIGRIYAQMGLFDRAVMHLQYYSDREPDAYHVNSQLGLALFRSGHSDAAIATWEEKVLSINATHPPALYFLAYALACKHDWAKSQRAIDILLSSAGKDNLFSVKAKQLRSSIGKVTSADSTGTPEWPQDLRDDLVFS